MTGALTLGVKVTFMEDRYDKGGTRYVATNQLNSIIDPSGVSGLVTESATYLQDYSLAGRYSGSCISPKGGSVAIVQKARVSQNTYEWHMVTVNLNSLQTRIISKKDSVSFDERNESGPYDVDWGGTGGGATGTTGTTGTTGSRPHRFCAQHDR